MSRINLRIDASIESKGGKSREKKKVPSMPPQTAEEANLILDELWEISPTLSLTCSMSALTGLRYSDASWLRYDDFYDEYGNFKEQFSVCQQKTFRMRMGRKKSDISAQEAFRKSSLNIYTNDEVRKIVEESRYYSCSSEFLFANKRSRRKDTDGNIIDRPMSIESASEHHARVKNKLRLKYHLGTHSWRKYFALMLLKQGASIEKIRDLLGHSSLVSTNAYLHTFSDDLKQVVTKLSLGNH